MEAKGRRFACPHGLSEQWNADETNNAWLELGMTDETISGAQEGRAFARRI